MNKTISAYFAKIGSKGGKKSRRAITPDQQAKMQKARKKKIKGDTANDTRRNKAIS